MPINMSVEIMEDMEEYLLKYVRQVITVSCSFVFPISQRFEKSQFCIDRKSMKEIVALSHEKNDFDLNICTSNQPEQVSIFVLHLVRAIIIRICL